MLGWAFANQSSKVPERGQSGATAWLRTVTKSFVKWKAGKRTTGGCSVCQDGDADALAADGRRRETMVTTTATAIVTVRNIPLDLLIIIPSCFGSKVGPLRTLLRHAG